MDHIQHAIASVLPLCAVSATLPASSEKVVYRSENAYDAMIPYCAASNPAQLPAGRHRPSSLLGGSIKDEEECSNFVLCEGRMRKGSKEAVVTGWRPPVSRV